MTCPFHRTNARGVFADSAKSGNLVRSIRTGGMGFVGWLNYRLTETIPTA